MYGPAYILPAAKCGIARKIFFPPFNSPRATHLIQKRKESNAAFGEGHAGCESSIPLERLLDQNVTAASSKCQMLQVMGQSFQ